MFPLTLLSTGDDGRWHIGIGDPTVVGWVTVVAYAVAAWFAWQARNRCLRVAQKPGKDPIVARNLIRMSWLWFTYTVILVFFGINKQLDLQTWFTEIARDWSKQQGWYNDRRRYQALFIGLIGVAGTVGLVVGIRLYKPVLRHVWMALLGMALLGTFVIIRAASFHYVDILLNAAPVSLNATLELGSLVVLIVAAQGKRKTKTPTATTASRRA
jgi:hypothetical protein